MKISLNWIKEFVDIPKKFSAQELGELLTLRTCEVEGWEESGSSLAGLKNVVVGELLSFEKIPETEKLHVGHLNIGKDKPLQVVFGKMVDMKVGDKIPVAVAPTKLPSGIEVTPKVIRGVLTEGMLCLDQELGLRDKGVSIHYFPSAQPGTSVAELLEEEDAHKYDHIIVGKIMKLGKHPNADRLNLVEVDIGERVAKIVCAGQNLELHMLVAVALPGAVTFDHEGGKMEIKVAKIRGEESFGMICAEDELGLPNITKHPAEVIISNLQEVCTYFQLPLPKAGTPLTTLLQSAKKDADTILEVDNKSITHRPDLWGHYGMAREFAAFLSQKLKPYEKAVSFPKFPSKGVSTKIVIEDDRICERAGSCIITGLKVAESPEWMKKRLLACGMRPVNNIVDVTNYVMLELGHPMHAFDRRAVENDTFIIRFPKAGEVFETLDHKKRVLTKEDALVTNGKKNLGLAGTIGGLESEINDSTTEVVLEACTWNPVMVRKISQRHNIRTDASQRFEKGLDAALIPLVMARAAELLLKLCPGAKIAGPMTDVKNTSPKTPVVALSLAVLSSKVGVAISGQEAKKLLEGLGFEVSAAVSLRAKRSNLSLKVKIPSWRSRKDVTIEDDLVEEVARMYGYEKIPPLLPDLPIKLPHENRERKLKHWCRDILSLELGFTEVLHHSFYNRKDFEKCFLPETPHLEVENPLSEDQTHLRTSLLPNMLKSAAKNLAEIDQLKMYEIGRRYRKNPGNYFPLEEKLITGLVVARKSKGEIFYEAKGALDGLLERFPAMPWSYSASKEVPPFAHPKKCADVFIQADKKYLIGQVFELHPLVLKNFGIDAHAAAFGLNFSILANLPLREPKYVPSLKFPGIDFDMSLLVSKRTLHADVQKLLQETDPELIHSVSLIDVFEDARLGDNKKSMTYRIHLQSDDRTLTDADMTAASAKITVQLEQNGFSVR